MLVLITRNYNIEIFLTQVILSQCKFSRFSVNNMQTSDEVL